jgi:hypothetical protein
MAINRNTAANLRSGEGAIQAFGPDHLQQRHLRMANFFKKASGHFAQPQAFGLAIGQLDCAQYAASMIGALRSSWVVIGSDGLHSPKSFRVGT